MKILGGYKLLSLMDRISGGLILIQHWKYQSRHLNLIFRPRGNALDSQQVRDAIARVRVNPIEGDSPVFAEPWHAQAFAIAQSLHQAGVFT